MLSDLLPLKQCDSQSFHQQQVGGTLLMLVRPACHIKAVPCNEMMDAALATAEAGLATQPSHWLVVTPRGSPLNSVPRRPLPSSAAGGRPFRQEQLGG